MSATIQPVKARRGPTDRRAAAWAGIDVTQTIVIGSRMIALSDRGDLYQWCSRERRWVRLELTNELIRERRKRYAGHPLMTPSVERVPA